MRKLSPSPRSCGTKAGLGVTMLIPSAGRLPGRGLRVGRDSAEPPAHLLPELYTTVRDDRWRDSEDSDAMHTRC